MKLSWLWNNVQSSSKTILTEVLKVKMNYVGGLPVPVKASQWSSEHDTHTLQMSSMRKQMIYQFDEHLSHYRFCLIRPLPHM